MHGHLGRRERGGNRTYPKSYHVRIPTYLRYLPNSTFQSSLRGVYLGLRSSLGVMEKYRFKLHFTNLAEGSAYMWRNRLGGRQE